MDVNRGMDTIIRHYTLNGRKFATTTCEYHQHSIFVFHSWAVGFSNRLCERCMSDKRGPRPS